MEGDQELEKNTLEYALRPNRIAMDNIRKTDGGPVGLVTRILGVTPRVYQYYELWSPAKETYNVLVPNLFNIPSCDLNLGSIDPVLRSLVAYTTSRAFGCSYCSGHAGHMGSLLHGSRIAIDKNINAMNPTPEDFSPRELAGMKIATKLGMIPVTVSREDIIDLATNFTELEQEAVVNAITTMGFLNRFMVTMGMTLEKKILEASLQNLGPSGWEPGIHFEEKADRELMEEDEEEETKMRKDPPNFFSYMFFLWGAKRADMKALAKIPSSDCKIYQLCKTKAGFVPYYLRRMLHSNAKHALAYAFLLRLCEGSEEVPTRVKAMMCYISATNAGNNILRAHFAFMAYRAGVSISRLVEITRGAGDASVATTDAGEAVVAAETHFMLSPSEKRVKAASMGEVGSTSGEPDDKEEMAMAMAQAASYDANSLLSPELVSVISWLYSPAAVIELVTTISLQSAFHRWTSVYVPMSYEPEVENFLGMDGNGVMLDLPLEGPAFKCQEDWDELARETRQRTRNDSQRAMFKRFSSWQG